MHLTSPSISQVFIQTGPVILAIAGFVIFKEKVSVRQGFGLLVVLLGMLVFYREQIVVLAHGLGEYKKGVLWVLFGAFSWSIYAISQKKAVVTHHPMQLNLVIFGLPAILMIPFVKFSMFANLNLTDWLILLFLGLNTLAAYGSLAFALKYLEANKISVIITLNPLITFTVMAWLSKKQVSWIEAENYTLLTIFGALTVITGVILTVWKRPTHKP